MRHMFCVVPKHGGFETVHLYTPLPSDVMRRSRRAALSERHPNATVVVAWVTRLEREATEALCSCMRIPPLRSAVKMESDVSPRTHAVVNTGVGTSVLASDGVQPLPPLMYISTFRLILPEAIAIGVRFSHASCTSLDS